MKPGNATLNPSMVTLAREAQGLTQSELATRASVSQGHLSKIEAGLWLPSAEVIERLAGELQVPEAFFFQCDQLTGPSVSEFFHRRRQDVSAKVLRQAHANINIVLVHLERLLRSAEIGESRIPRLDVDECGSVAEAAGATRAMWGLPPGPIHNLIQSIETAGGIVIRCAFGSPRVDAISRWVPGLPAVFFLNAGTPADRERLSLAHELGHMILHRIPDQEMEQEANQFAAELLMPERDIRPDFGRVTLQALARLKPYWRTSMAALLHRASDLGAVSERNARFLWMQMGKAGYRRREPQELDLPLEEPRLFHSLFELHLGELGYSLEQLAEALCAMPAVLAHRYGLRTNVQGRTLRLLK